MYNPRVNKRSTPAWEEMLRTPTTWTDAGEVLVRMLRASDIGYESVGGLLADGVKAGLIESQDRWLVRRTKNLPKLNPVRTSLSQQDVFQRSGGFGKQ